MSHRRQEIERLRNRIAEVVAQREAIKQEIATGALRGTQGLRRLEPLDRELSTLDSAFKQRWDAQQAGRPLSERALECHDHRDNPCSGYDKKPRPERPNKGD